VEDHWSPALTVQPRRHPQLSHRSDTHPTASAGNHADAALAPGRPGRSAIEIQPHCETRPPRPPAGADVVAATRPNSTTAALLSSTASLTDLHNRLSSNNISRETLALERVPLVRGVRSVHGRAEHAGDLGNDTVAERQHLDIGQACTTDYLRCGIHLSLHTRPLEEQQLTA
jgi:hypothetical protein